uniref:Secreted protein n=1 Tax=Amphimedon queenslandica TaxID=400682 RepID=A0A1X7TUL6_AMPQE
MFSSSGGRIVLMLLFLYQGPTLSPIGSPVGGAGGGAYNDSNEISAFFNVLKSCAHVFEYIGRIAINKK